jgi:hypothetical protein
MKGTFFRLNLKEQTNKFSLKEAQKSVLRSEKFKTQLELLIYKLDVVARPVIPAFGG